MLNWLFKKRVPVAAPIATPPRAAPAATAAKPRAEVDTTDWTARLAAARGDDTALLQLALSAPLLQHRGEAADAISSEAGLRLAEREFRKRDRKLHSRIKHRLEAAVTQREARASAELLLARARHLLGQEILPVNGLLALDKAWAALPAAALEPAQGEAYTDLRQQLDRALHARGEAQQQLTRWTTELQPLLQAWPRQLETLAREGCAADAAALGTAVDGWRRRRPAAAEGGADDLMLNTLAQLARLLEQKLLRFAQSEEAKAAAEAAPLPGIGETNGAAEEHAEVAAASPLHQRLLQLLEDRWIRQQQPAPAPVTGLPTPPLPDTAAGVPAQAPSRTPGSARPTPEQGVQLGQLLQDAEAAAAEGRLAGLQPPLQALERLLADAALLLPADLRARHLALRTEQRRLQDWQQWGGARAREALVAQAEALASACATEPAATDEPIAPGPAPARRPAALNLKLHAEHIQALRKQWKQLDPHGAPASPALWQRFDGALQAAYQPVAAQHLQLRAARQENLAAREALLADLEGATPEQPPAEGDPAAWRHAGLALAQFQTAWRKLGPVEHTVPAAARDALQQRLQQALSRIDAPLQRARADAVARREQLIARAEALLQEPVDSRGAAEPGRRLRDLQAEWTEQARQFVLPRALETSLWARFKGAADGLQALREQGQAAREAALAAQRSAELSRQARWAAQCAALGLALARCEAREDGHATGDGAAASADAARLPSAWSHALDNRTADTANPADVDDQLLRTELALDLPSPDEQLALRQQLKLLALKQAMEGRVQVESPAPGALLLTLLRHTGLAPAQRARLQAIIASLGQREPGALGLPAAVP